MLACVQWLHYVQSMVTVESGDGWRIKVYPDHAPPHCHVETKEGSVRLRLPECEPMNTVPAKARKAIGRARERAKEIRDQLMVEWSRLNERR